MTEGIMQGVCKIVACFCCGKDTNNPKFCSRSCSAKVTNKVPKRKIIRVCTRCDSVVRNSRSSLCEKHFLHHRENFYRDKTLGEYRNKNSVRGFHSSWTNSHIRIFARNWLKHLTKLPCKKCGYSKHVEVAHIRAVSDFRDDELLRDVNSADNIVQLCRNCHWEFDNGFLDIIK